MNFAFGSARSPRTIALVGKYHNLEIAESLRPPRRISHERGVSVFIERETVEQIGKQVDLSRWVTCGFNDIVPTPTSPSSSGRRHHAQRRPPPGPLPGAPGGVNQGAWAS